MKTISMPNEEYEQDMTSARESGFSSALREIARYLQDGYTYFSLSDNKEFLKLKPLFDKLKTPPDQTK